MADLGCYLLPVCRSRISAAQGYRESLYSGEISQLKEQALRRRLNNDIPSPSLDDLAMPTSTRDSNAGAGSWNFNPWIASTTPAQSTMAPRPGLWGPCESEFCKGLKDLTFYLLMIFIFLYPIYWLLSRETEAEALAVVDRIVDLPRRPFRALFRRIDRAYTALADWLEGGGPRDGEDPDAHDGITYTIWQNKGYILACALVVYCLIKLFAYGQDLQSQRGFPLHEASAHGWDVPQWAADDSRSRHGEYLGYTLPIRDTTPVQTSKVTTTVERVVTDCLIDTSVDQRITTVTFTKPAPPAETVTSVVTSYLADTNIDHATITVTYNNAEEAEAGVAATIEREVTRYLTETSLKDVPITVVETSVIPPSTSTVTQDPITKYEIIANVTPTTIRIISSITVTKLKTSVVTVTGGTIVTTSRITQHPVETVTKTVTAKGAGDRAAADDDVLRVHGGEEGEEEEEFHGRDIGDASAYCKTCRQRHCCNVT